MLQNRRVTYSYGRFLVFYLLRSPGVQLYAILLRKVHELFLFRSVSSAETLEELTTENTTMSEYEMLRMERIERMRQIATDSKEVIYNNKI